MAVAVVASNSGNNATSSSITVALDATGANFLEAVVSWREDGGTPTLTGITQAGNAMTSRFNVVDDSIIFGMGFAKFYIANPTAGSQNVVATLSGATPAGMTMTVVAFSGVDTASPYRGSLVSDVNDGGAANVSATISSDAADLVVGTAGFRGGTSTTPTITGGQTSIVSNAGVDGGGETPYLATFYEAGAASVTCSYSYSPTGTYNAGIILDSLQAAAAGGSTAHLLSGKFGALLRGKI